MEIEDKKTFVCEQRSFSSRNFPVSRVRLDRARQGGLRGSLESQPLPQMSRSQMSLVLRKAPISTEQMTQAGG